MMLKKIFSLLGNERGEAGTAEAATDAGATGETTPAGGASEATETLAEGATSNGDGEASPEESFVDPATLPPELKAHWKRMHGSFTKRTQELAQLRKELGTKAGSYDRLMADADYARQVILEAAPRLGLKIAEEGKTNGNGQARHEAASSGSAPAELVEAIAAKLPAELKWMAQAQADAFYEANKIMLAPFEKEREEQSQKQRQAEFDSLAEELSGVAPEWVDREDDMNDLLQFLLSPDMKHPRFGSKLRILYDVINGNATATQEATRRMSAAVKNKSTTGKTAGAVTDNIAERIRGAKTEQEKWDLAAKAAIEQTRR